VGARLYELDVSGFDKGWGGVGGWWVAGINS